MYMSTLQGLGPGKLSEARENLAHEANMTASLPDDANLLKPLAILYSRCCQAPCGWPGVPSDGQRCLWRPPVRSLPPPPPPPPLLPRSTGLWSILRSFHVSAFQELKHRVYAIT